MKTATIATTHLISDAMGMHQFALEVEGNRARLDEWEKSIRTEVFPNKPLRLISRLLFTCQNEQRTSILLHRAYPVLKDAFPAPVELTCTASLLAFDTRRFGKVHLLLNYDRNECDVFQSFVSSSNTDGSPSIEKGRPEMTLTLHNKGDPNAVRLVHTTMVIFQEGCRACKQTGVKMQKCGRCWGRLHFPVCYCCKDCQTSDYARHRQEDRCGQV